ncbi:MAG: hypothetical protein WD228_09860 [Mycobacterium sp.]
MADDLEDRAATARGTLRELSMNSLAALRALGRGTVAEASLHRGVSRFFPGASPGRISTGRTVFKLGAKASDLGISEDGILGTTDDGALVRMSRWLLVEGGRPVDPRDQSHRFRRRLAGRARRLGCEALMSVYPNEAYGEPQPETRFNRAYRNVFYLDDAGVLVFGHPGAAVDAADWFVRH